MDLFITFNRQYLIYISLFQLSEKKLFKLRQLRLKNPVKYTAKKLAQLAHVSPTYIEQTVPAAPFNTARLAALKAKLDKRRLSPEEKERRRKLIQNWLEQQKANMPIYVVCSSICFISSPHSLPHPLAFKGFQVRTCIHEYPYDVLCCVLYEMKQTLKKKWRQAAYQDITEDNSKWIRSIIKRTIRQDKSAARFRKERKARSKED
jgi:hypothetical protein